MRILVDENIPGRTIASLRAMGHEVLDIRGTGEQGIPDETLWEKAVREQALLITTDKGFSGYRNHLHQGILIVRLRQPNTERIHQRILQAMAQFDVAVWPGMTVVMRDQVQSVYRQSPSDPA